MTPQRIVILGGGFGGAYTAMHLERRLRGRPGVEIALVSRDNYLVFQPLIPGVVSSSIGIVDTITPLRRLCPRTRLYIREIEAVDLHARTVTLSPGFRPKQLVIPFDHLVIALGNVMGGAELAGVQQHAFPFKTIGDALHLRNHVIRVLQEAAIETDPEHRRALTTFVVAGGGFSGVEIAAELNDFVREVVKDYDTIPREELAVTLLHSRDRILPELNDRLGRFAEQVLTRRGVEIRHSVRLAGATGAAALLNNGERIPTHTIVTTAPAVINPALAALPLKREGERLVVDECLAVPGYLGVWAVGDCAAIRDRKTDRLVPTTAQHAIREARRVAENIAADIDGRPRSAFAFSGFGHLASLGRRSAVGQIFGINVSGLFAWLMWRTVYLFKLPGLDRKARVGTSWFLDLFLREDIVQLKTDRTSAIGYEHFEAGELVVRQGDYGNKLYIVKTGEVEVLKERPGVEPERIVTRGPGQYFGEMALLMDVPRQATVRALKPVDLIAVSREDFLALIGAFPALRSVFEDFGHHAAPGEATVRSPDAV